MGAGFAMSEGIKALELTATRATINMAKIIKGMMYWRKKLII